ncbi:hypothetical protein [Bacillus sp. ISL-37]|jgi:hypothetical protein|uniref:hypothetical protein n=1 Tax=Bacillus sp. ISL-37 TaxID=2819123 RepID=UPI001BE76295|nr:hypothetical protein [Bacillus sp. ISL-37]MBT2686124.1 hypothetical protein [Bacillus sp. ISL-37]
MKNKLNLPQALFASFIIATILTFTNHMIAWENKIYAGIFAFIVSLAVFYLTQKVIKD